jgi:hypothetical protein
MPTITQGNSTKIQLGQNDVLTVLGIGTVEVIAGGPYASTSVSTSQVFGPYGYAAKLRITATSGSVTTSEVSEYPVAVSPVAVDQNGVIRRQDNNAALPVITRDPTTGLITDPAGIRAVAVAAGSGTRGRLNSWVAAILGGGLDTPRKMASPPTVSRSSSNVSALTGDTDAGNLPARGRYADIDTCGHQVASVFTGSPNWLRGFGPPNTDGSLTGPTLWRARFMTHLSDFELPFYEAGGGGQRLNMRVNGEFVALDDAAVPVPGSSGGIRYYRFNFGTNTTTYGLSSTSVPAGGTGYVLDELLTVVGGTFTRPATYRISGVSGGVVTGITLNDPGNYSVLPTFPAATTGGSGTGCTVASYAAYPKQSLAVPRRIELLYESGAPRLYGVHYAPWTPGEAAFIGTPRNPLVPRLYWMGDSQDAPTLTSYAGSTVSFMTAIRLRMDENVVIDAKGGTGFNQPNGVSPAFDHANRIAGAIAASPDVVVFSYSQNVGSNTQVTSQASALAFVTQLQNALPNTLFVMVGPANLAQSWHQAAMQYVMANSPAPSRIRMIDTVAQGLAVGGSAGMLNSDNTHWGTWANREWRSLWLAQQIRDCLLDMLL